MKTIHISEDNHKLLYTLKSSDQSYDDIVGELINDRIEQLQINKKSFTPGVFLS